MKLKSKNFKFMERTNALLKMLAAAEGITETEFIENALEAVAPEEILKAVNSIYGEKLDRDDVRVERKRNNKASKSVIRKKDDYVETKNNEDNVQDKSDDNIVENNKEVVTDKKNNNAIDSNVDGNVQKPKTISVAETETVEKEVVEEVKFNKDNSNNCSVFENEMLDEDDEMALTLDTVTDDLLEQFM